MIGQTLDGKYLIASLLGEGGMGAVYEARHTGTSRRVAVKVITGDVGKHASLVTRFQREARAAGAIDTQHIAQVIDTGTDPATGAPYMVMEFLAGEDLQQLLRRAGPIAPDLALRIALQTCIGLGKAHETHVVHRDIKPANIFLAERDGGEVIVKILDFGIAKIKQDQELTGETAGLTRTGSMLGSPLYMSPEQARGHKTIDHRADIWSLGIVLYQALTGRTPYDHIDALGELVIAICSEAPAPVQDLSPWVPPEVAAIVHRALRFEPAERYQSAGEMYGAIKALLPNGYALHKAMLNPIDAEAKAVVARKLEVAVPTPLASHPSLMPGRQGSSPSMPPPGASHPSHPSYPSARPLSHPSHPALDPAIARGESGAATDQGVSRESESAASKRSPMGAIVALVAIVAAAGGVALYKVARHHDTPSAPAGQVEAAIVAPAPPPVVLAPPPPPAVTPARAAQVAPSLGKTVKVTLVPADASVEVDHAPATANSGVLEIVGPPGTVRQVHLFKGKLEKTEDVVITEAGAVPSKLELPPSKAK